MFHGLARELGRVPSSTPPTKLNRGLEQQNPIALCLSTSFSVINKFYKPRDMVICDQKNSGRTPASLHRLLIPEAALLLQKRDRLIDPPETGPTKHHATSPFLLHKPGAD